MNLLADAALVVASFFLGAIPFGLVVSRLFFRRDLRAEGSGNIGAANALRTLGKGGAIAVLILDALKGALPVVAGRALDGTTLAAVAAFAAIAGHCFSPFLNFRGGKGVATSLGAFILLTPKSILCMVVLFLLIAVALRYVSLASVAVAAAFPLLAWAWREYRDSRQLLLIAAVSALVIWKHRQNIGRIATGTESKLGRKPHTEPRTLGATRP